MKQWGVGPGARPEALLERAQSLWLSSRESYRDAMLGVGQLLHQYVLCRVAEGESRRIAISRAAARLNCKNGKINSLIRTFSARDLLYQGENLVLGRISYGALESLGQLVVRKSQGQYGISCETWEVRGNLDLARGIYCKAVLAGWGRQVIVEKVAGYLGPSNDLIRSGTRVIRRGCQETPLLPKMGGEEDLRREGTETGRGDPNGGRGGEGAFSQRTALGGGNGVNSSFLRGSPRDVADQIVEAVARSPDRVQLAEILLRQLKEIAEGKGKIYGFSDGFD